MYQALYRKYRPKTFDDVVGQQHITETLKNQIITGRLSHAYLFTGTRGTGKTTCAKILAKAVNCENPQNGNPCNCCASCLGIESGAIIDVLEIDAASNNGVDNIRSLRDDSVYSPAGVKKRVYIVDEVHMLSTAAFNALLKIMEEPPEHLMFILATTELNKVPATILSRCQRFSFKRITPEDIAQRLEYVSQKESISLAPGAAKLLARLSDGALRDALSIMDQCTVPGGSLSTEDIYRTLGLAGNIKTAAIMEAIGKKQPAEAIGHFHDLYSAGKDISAFFSELSSLTRDLLMLKTAGNKVSLLGGYDDATMNKLSGLFTFESLMNIMEVLQSTQSALTYSANRQADGELCLLHLCSPAYSSDISALTARVSELEAALKDIRARGITVTAIESPPEYDELSPPPPTDEDAPPAEQMEAKPAFLQQEGPKSGQESADFWPKLIEGIKGKIDIMSSMYLSNAELVSGSMAGDELLVSADNQFILNVISKDEVKLQIAQKAAEILGTRPVVRFVLAGELDPKSDMLEDLINKAKGYDNIKIID